jgi:hypothetical protein
VIIKNGEETVIQENNKEIPHKGYAGIFVGFKGLSPLSTEP